MDTSTVVISTDTPPDVGLSEVLFGMDATSHKLDIAMIKCTCLEIEFVFFLDPLTAVQLSTICVLRYRGFWVIFYLMKYFDVLFFACLYHMTSFCKVFLSSP